MANNKNQIQRVTRQQYATTGSAMQHRFFVDTLQLFNRPAEQAGTAASNEECVRHRTQSERYSIRIGNGSENVDGNSSEHLHHLEFRDFRSPITRDHTINRMINM